MAPKHKSTPARNPLHFDASSSFDSAPLSLQFHDDDAHNPFSENFSRRSIHSKRQVILVDFTNTNLPTVIHSQGWESLCDILVTCLLVLVQEFYSNMHGIDRSAPLFFTRVQGMGIPITPQLVADALRVPRVEFPDYPSCEHLQTMSKDELKSTFCEYPSEWGKCLFTYCSALVKGPRFLNMVMTFVLHLLSHYNSITEPRAQFLFSLLKYLTIDFPSHFILSISLVISSSFLLLSRGSYTIFPSRFQRLTLSPSCVPQITLPLNIARLSLCHDKRIQYLPPV